MYKFYRLKWIFCPSENCQAEWRAAQMDENASAGLEDEEEDGVCLPHLTPSMVT